MKYPLSCHSEAQSAEESPFRDPSRSFRMTKVGLFLFTPIILMSVSEEESLLWKSFTFVQDDRYLGNTITNVKLL
ncbi:hypothetical protein IKU74_02055 [bacterium]|nr:hypothetical protein [bacterium]